MNISHATNDARRDAHRVTLAVLIIVALMVAAMFGGTHLRHDVGACNGPQDSRWSPYVHMCVERGGTQVAVTVDEEDSPRTAHEYALAKAHCAQAEIERDTDNVLRVYGRKCH